MRAPARDSYACDKCCPTQDSQAQQTPRGRTKSSAGQGPPLSPREPGAQKEAGAAGGRSLQWEGGVPSGRGHVCEDGREGRLVEGQKEGGKGGGWRNWWMNRFMGKWRGDRGRKGEGGGEADWLIACLQHSKEAHWLALGT